MRFAKVFLIAITITSVLSSTKSFAESTCEQFFGQHKEEVIALQTQTIKNKQTFLRLLGHFLKVDLIGVPEWSFAKLSGSSISGAPRSLEVEILTKDIPTNNEDLPAFLEKAQNLRSVEALHYDISRVVVRIQKEARLNDPQFNFTFDGSTVLESFNSTDNLFEATIKTPSGYRTYLRMEKIDNILHVAITNERPGLRRWFSFPQSFIAHNNTWQSTRRIP